MEADILVVDDDPGIRLVIADMLRLGGYAVRVASDGVEALRQCETSRPRVMILDLAMPLLDGFGVIRELKSRGWRPEVAVFVLTARAGACEQLQASTPVEACAQKPFDIDDLLDTVESLLNR